MVPPSEVRFTGGTSSRDDSRNRMVSDIDDKDRRDFVARVGKVARETGTKIFAWVLMSNHVHPLIFGGPPGI